MVRLGSGSGPVVRLGSGGPARVRWSGSGPVVRLGSGGPGHHCVGAVAREHAVLRARPRHQGLGVAERTSTEADPGPSGPETTGHRLIRLRFRDPQTPHKPSQPAGRDQESPPDPPVADEWRADEWRADEWRADELARRSRVSGIGFNPSMSRRASDASISRAVRRSHARVVEDLTRLREDAGLSRTRIALEAGVDRRFLDRIEAGTARPSIETYQRLATALGADLSVRVYPNTGPAIRDRHQARLLELLLNAAHPRWQVFTEVQVRRPGRGWIDAVLHDPVARLIVASELQSELRRLEQLIRWQATKAESLPSWEGWAHLGEEPAISRLLVVRRTRATREVAREFGRQLRVAYPAHPDDALAALGSGAPWPGPAMVWAVLDGPRSRLAAGR